LEERTVTWRELWDETAAVLGERPQARWICETASGLFGDEFLEGLDERATERMVAQLDAMVARYRAGEPLQYVLGHWSFRRLDLFVDRRVLIPRPETELVAELAIERARAATRRDPAGARTPIVVADLGTGSGAIGLSLASELPISGVTVWLTDASADALAVARANTAGLGRAASNVRVAEGSWFGALPDALRGRLDVVVANPPYIAEGDPEVAAAVHEWEPPAALYAGTDGLADIRAIAATAPRWLRPGGSLVLEIGHRQGPAVAEILAAAGLVHVEIRQDLAGLDRIAVAERP
jgi:release factor glutamine methyltransferase